MLEIAASRSPDGYGNSYFWVKPDRIVPREPRQGRRRPARTSPVRRSAPSTRSRARQVARWFKAKGIDTLGVCFLHAYANLVHEERMREIIAEEHP